MVVGVDRQPAKAVGKVIREIHLAPKCIFYRTTKVLGVICFQPAPLCIIENETFSWTMRPCITEAASFSEPPKAVVEVGRGSRSEAWDY